MSRLVQRVIAPLALFLVASAAVLAQQGQSAAPPHIDRFFACADAVALVGIKAAELTDVGVIYSAKVLHGFKGAPNGSDLYFVAPGGGRIGSQLVVFLRRDTTSVSSFLRTNSKLSHPSLFISVPAALFRPVFGENSTIDVDIPSGIATPADMAAGRLWANMILSKMELPDYLAARAVPLWSARGTVAESARMRWLLVKDLTSYLDSVALRNPSCNGVAGTQPVIDEAPLDHGIVPEGSRVLSALDSLPPHIMNALVQHLRGRITGEMLKKLYFRTAVMADSALYRPDPDRPNGVAPYEINFVYIDPDAGVPGLRVWILIDWDGRIVSPARFPDMVGNEAKRRVITRDQADAIGRSKSEQASPIGSYIVYEPKFGSLVWHVRYGTAADPLHFREVWVDAHSSEIIGVFDMTAVNVGAGTR